jgi:epoxyqueuosine reductase QueG
MGLGKRGKSTVVLHDKYGARLRFAAVQTNAPLEPPACLSSEEEKSPSCSGCTVCIDDCPVNVLEPYQMPDKSDCLSNIDIMPKDKDRLVPCDICLLRCPANR